MRSRAPERPPRPLDHSRTGPQVPAQDRHQRIGAAFVLKADPFLVGFQLGHFLGVRRRKLAEERRKAAVPAR